MKKTIQHLAVLVSIVLLSSFTRKNTENFIGTYGVCASDPSQIKLTINADHTFYYQDLSVVDHKIVVNGSWIQKGNKVILKDPSGQRFHNVWTFGEHGQIAKSRKGLTFYRLGKTGV